MPRFDPATPLVHPLPGPERAEVRPAMAYAKADGRELAMDLYLPSGPVPGSPVPAVLLVHGEAHPAVLRGVRYWGQYTGWGRLLAAEGLAGVMAEHRAVAEAGFDAVVAEVASALAAVHDRAAELGVDPDRLAVAAGLPVELVDLPDGHHAFDTVDDTDASRDAIRRVLSFLRGHLTA